MIQDPSKELTIIVYDTPAPPKYLKINKKLIRLILSLTPILIMLLISGSFAYSFYLKKQVSALKSLEPKVKLKLATQKETYEKRISALTRTNQDLTQKLSRGATVADDTASLLSLFTVPLATKDLRSNDLISIEEIKLTTDSNQVKLTFNLVKNNAPEGEKLTGYMTVVQFQGNILQFYPANELNEKNLKLEYASGEYYSFSNLRPSTTTFSKISSKSSRFKIFLFSRTGDLILYQQIGPFNVE